VAHNLSTWLTPKKRLSKVAGGKSPPLLVVVAALGGWRWHVRSVLSPLRICSLHDACLLWHASFLDCPSRSCSCSIIVACSSALWRPCVVPVTFLSSRFCHGYLYVDVFLCGILPWAVTALPGSALVALPSLFAHEVASSSAFEQCFSPEWWLWVTLCLSYCLV